MKNQIWNQDQTNVANVQPIGESASGNALLVKAVGDGAGGEVNVIAIPIGQKIADGNIAGTREYTIPGKKEVLSAAVLDDLTEIPGTTVVMEPGGVRLEVVSSSIQDGVAGSGVITLDLYYLDSNGVEREEVVTMNGTTPVPTNAINIDFIQWAHSAAVGSTGVSVGNISIRGVGGGTVYEYITAGGNQSLSGRYKIPAGHTGYIIGWQASGFTKRIDFRLRATVERFDRALLPGIFLFQDILNIENAASGWRTFIVPKRCPAGSVVKMSAISIPVGGSGSGSFDIRIVADA